MFSVAQLPVVVHGVQRRPVFVRLMPEARRTVVAVQVLRPRPRAVPPGVGLEHLLLVNPVVRRCRRLAPAPLVGVLLEGVKCDERVVKSVRPVPLRMEIAVDGTFHWVARIKFFLSTIAIYDGCRGRGGVIVLQAESAVTIRA